MNKIETNTYINNLSVKSKRSSKKEEPNDSLNLDAHTSNKMKVKRPKITVNDLKSVLPVQKTFSDKEATKRIQAINTDIYEGATKEKEKHEFNLKRYFTIFGIIALITAAITYFRKK